MSIRGVKNRERWVKTLHADDVRFMSWLPGSGCDALILRYWMELRARRAELELYQSLALFPCSVLSSLQVPANLSCLLCPTAVTFPGFLPALGQEVKSQRVSTKKGKPIIFMAHCIRLLLFVPFAVPMGRCSCQCRFFSTSLEADGLQTAISWTPALCYKVDAFLLVITDINWTPLCWAL